MPNDRHFPRVGAVDGVEEGEMEGDAEGPRAGAFVSFVGLGAFVGSPLVGCNVGAARKIIL